MSEKMRPHELNAEEIANAADKLLKSLSENIEKFLSAGTSATESTNNKSTFYKSATASVLDKRKQFEENLKLVEQGREALHEAIQENRESKFVSPSNRTALG